MKTFTFASTLALTLRVSASPVENNRIVAGPMDWEIAPQGMRIIPKLADQPIIDGAMRREILYGPYNLGAGDMMSKYEYNTDTPCNDCYVTGMSVTLKWPDSREALASEGVWLHHCLMTSGATRLLSNALAPRTKGIIWAAANERPTLRLNSRHRYGIDWPDVFSYTVDLASERDDDIDVYLSITFEYVPKSSPQGRNYRGAYMYWNTIGDPDEIPRGRMAFDSEPWKSTMNGKLLWTSGHLHDGGTAQVMYINGRPVCNSTQFYAKNYDFGHNMHNGARLLNKNGPQPNYNQPYYGPNGPQAFNGLQPNYNQPNFGPNGLQIYNDPQAFNGPKIFNSQQAYYGPQPDFNQPNYGPNGPPAYNDPNAMSRQFNRLPLQGNTYQQQNSGPNAAPLQYNYKRQNMNHGGAFGGDHIESPGACTDFGDIRKGDIMVTRAFYDMTVHRPMTHKGEEEKVMGNMRVFIGPVD